MNDATNSNQIEQPRAAPNFAANLWWLVFSGAVSVANSVLVWVFLARWRDAEELGAFTVVMGLYALFFNVCSCGLQPYFVAEISRRRAVKADSNLDAFFGTAVSFLICSGAICAIASAALGFWLTATAEARTANAILSLALIPTALITFAEASSIAAGRGRLIASVTTLENFLRTVVPLILIIAGGSMTWICVSFLAVRIVALLVYRWQNKAGEFVFEKTEFAKLLRVAPTFAGTIFFSALNWQIPILLLAAVAIKSESARFGVASRFFIPAAIFAAGFANAVQPGLTREWEKSAAAGAAYLRRRAGLVLLVTGAAAVLSPFLSPFVLSFLFGAKYTDAARVLDLLAVAVVPFALVVVTARGLVAANAARIDLYANIAGAIVCLAVGAQLVPLSGATGAAWAQIVSFAVMAIIEVGFLSVTVNRFRFERAAVNESG